MKRTLGTPALLAVAVILAAVLVIDSDPVPVEASHLCPNTGSPFGPFDFQTYEAADYKNVYARTLELAGFNQLFPDVPSFAMPRLETGDRSAGSGWLGDTYIPPVLLKAIAWIESGWAQGDYSVPYGAVGPTLASHDCGYGIMQITSGMQNVSGVPNLDQAMIGGHFGFNIARGARILADKWNQAPEFRPIVGNRDAHVLENWYYALWAYNGFAFKNHPFNPAYDPNRAPYRCDGTQPRSAYPYQELVLGCVANPPWKGGGTLWIPQAVSLPNLSDPTFATPLRVENWAPCSQSLQCAPMDMPTPNPANWDPTVLSQNRNDALGEPSLAITTSAIALQAIPGGESLPVTVTISNTGSGPLVWRATSSATWLRVSRNQGVSTGANIGGAAQTLSVYAHSAGLPPGIHHAKVAIESLFSWSAPTLIEVTLLVDLQAGATVGGDFNADGKTDLLFLCCSDYASIWTSAGDGTFTSNVFSPWPQYAMSAGSWAAGDFNGDARSDLIHFCCEDFANVWLSNGDGTFNVTPFRPWPSYDLQAGSWQFGDFNADGKTDLLHLCCKDYGTMWFSNGDGTFRIGSFRPWENYGIHDGSWQAADVTGDGKADLVHFCCQGYANVWISRGDENFQLASFAPWPNYDMQHGPWIAGNFNDDNRLDFLHLCCDDYANIWHSGGDGSFSVTSFRPWDAYGMQYGGWIAGNLNDDNRTDLVHLCCSDHANSWISTADGRFEVGYVNAWPGYGFKYGYWQAGDHNGDAQTDLLHLCCHYVNVWESLGYGAFRISPFYP